METAIIVALITGACSVLGVILSNAASNRRVEQALQTSQAVTDTKIDELTREVREHNGFAKRIPVIEEQIAVLRRDVDDLKKGD